MDHGADSEIDEALKFHPLMEGVLEHTRNLILRDVKSWVILSLTGSLVAAPDHSETAGEAYAFALQARLIRLGTVTSTLKTCAQSLRGAVPAGLEGLGEIPAFQFIRYHLAVHRTQMLTIRDSVNRLIAEVWDLGVPERALTNEKIITENTKMTPELRTVLGKFGALTAKYARERHDIVHAGGVAAIPGVDVNALIAEVRKTLKANNEDTKGALAEWLKVHRLAIADGIDAEVNALTKLCTELYDALLPDYQCQRRRIEEVERVSGEPG